MTRRLAAFVGLAVAAGSLTVSGQSRPGTAPPLAARVGQTGFIQLRADSFETLSPKQQALAYWLTQASIAIDPIIYDQLSSFGLRQKRLLEAIVAHESGIDPGVFARVRDFALLFWGNRGNHNEQTSQKFVPSFTADDLETAALKAQANGAFRTPYADMPPLTTPDDLRRELRELQSAFFDAGFEPMMTAKTPPPGRVYRAGTPDGRLPRNFQPPVVKAVEALIETGDFRVVRIGDNLPNENSIHEKYGTKNFLLLGSSHALDAAGSSIEEFAATPAEADRNTRYGEEAEDLLTAMHEVIGHGSGKLTDRVKDAPQKYLKEYYSTLEEGRADLMGLWNVWDPKLKELGLVKDQEEVAKAMYDSAARAALTQLRRNPKGDTLEEDHQRDRQLIVNFVMEKTGGIRKLKKNGKTYFVVADYQKMRQGIGRLLADLMRIKAEGDYAAIKALVDKYGVHFDPALRDEVVARYAKLDVPTFWAGVNPVIVKNGATFTIEYPGDPVRQYLSYGAMYDESLAAAMPSLTRKAHAKGNR